MNNYQIKTESSKHFILFKNNIEIGNILFSNWKINKFQLVVNGDNYQLNYNNLFTSNGTVLKNNIAFCNVTKFLRGNRQFEILNNLPTIYNTKNKGFWNYRSCFFNSQNQEVYYIKSKFNWSRFNYNFNVNMLLPNEINADNEFLILVHLYFIMLDMRRKNAAAS